MSFPGFSFFFFSFLYFLLLGSNHSIQETSQTCLTWAAVISLIQFKELNLFRLVNNLETKCDSSEVEVLAILEAFRCFSRLFHGELIIESDSSNAIAWVFNRKINPWKSQFIFNEIRLLSSSFGVVFHLEIRSADSFADALASGLIGRLLRRAM